MVGRTCLLVHLFFENENLIDILVGIKSNVQFSFIVFFYEIILHLYNFLYKTINNIFVIDILIIK